MPASAPPRVAPASVTVLPLPTFASANAAVPPVSATSSPLIAVGRERMSTVAVVLPSYGLLAAVKVPVMCNCLITPVSAETKVTS